MIAHATRARRRARARIRRTVIVAGPVLAAVDVALLALAAAVTL